MIKLKENTPLFSEFSSNNFIVNLSIIKFKYCVEIIEMKALRLDRVLSSVQGHAYLSR